MTTSMPSPRHVTRTLLGLLVGASCVPPPAAAQQLPLVQYPAGTARREPAPNVILTIDDSGSMAYYGNGTEMKEEDPRSGMYALKTALRAVFSAETQNIPDGSIRLAWNAFNRCRPIPASGTNDGGCAGRNALKSLAPAHRANFLNWVGMPGEPYSSTHLGASSSTPTHHAYIAAGDYLKNATAESQNSPWAADPGVTRDPVLSCRRSYSILMTDGGWNWNTSHGTDVARGAGNGNADGSPLTLPDGRAYDPASAQTRIYADAVGGHGSYTSSTGTYTGNFSTLADLAFHYWATDLAPRLDNDVAPSWRVRGTSTVGSGASAVALDEYWNPRNNPAQWQSLTTYVIGFRDASAWRTDDTFSDFPTWANDTYAGSFDALVTGEMRWPSPLLASNSLGLGVGTTRATNSEEARKVELWHMAINGRGRFIPATNSAADLVRAFQEIFGEIVAETSAPITSFANASTSVARGATTQFTSGYAAANWLGYVRADTVTQGTGDQADRLVATPAAGWGVGPKGAHLTTADKLDALDAQGIADRLILSWRDGAQGRPVSFEWAADQRFLSTAQKDLLKGSTDDTAAANLLGQQRLDFIRGDRSLETTTMRQRASRQGDIVNSALWYVAEPVATYAFDNYLAFAKRHAKRLPMVYVGGNDGMLHGFSGEDGSEKIAYVPKGVIANLAQLTRRDYRHRYYVDGSPFSGDVNRGEPGTPDWRTLLVGTLGAGGKGYFVLDVTTPGSSRSASASQTVASNFSKDRADALVVMDKTSAAGSTTEDADIGHIMVRPVLEDNNPQKTTQIVRMNDNRWALVMGNGYNSTNERPVLLVQYLDETRELLKVPAASSGADAKGNGLSAPRLVDIDGNGTPDVVYAGDLRGNLWKFDISSSDAGRWGVAFSGQPLYTAASLVDKVSTPQPITAPPLVRANERGGAGLMVAFGTGRNVTERDRLDTAVQTLYAVLDHTRYRRSGADRVEVDPSARPAAKPVGAGRASLVRQRVDATVTGINADGAVRDFWTVTQNEVPYLGDGAKRGWYLDLPERGERVLEQMGFYDNSNIIELVSEVPGSGGNTDESCDPPSQQPRRYRTLLNIMDGKRPSVQVIDTNHDGIYTALDGNVSRMTASTAENRITTKTHQIRVAGGAGGAGQGGADRMLRLPEIPLRPNWRQLQ